MSKEYIEYLQNWDFARWRIKKTRKKSSLFIYQNILSFYAEWFRLTLEYYFL